MSILRPSDNALARPVAVEAHSSHAIEIMQRFLTRQPILDLQDQVVGYELKRRDRVPVEILPGTHSLQEAQDEHLLISAIDLDFQKALGNKLTFLAISPQTLLNPLVEQLPKDKVILAVNPGKALDPAVESRAQELAAQGFLLALDDDPDLETPSPMLGACRYVRLDSSRFDVMALAERIALLQRGPGKGPDLIATQVDTLEAFESCEKLGFGLLQGYYFTQLEPAKASRMDVNVMRVMDLLNKVIARAEINEIEASFKMDPALSYKLLRYINSPAIGLRSTITSIGHALSLLGYDQTYRWLTLLLFSSVRATARNQALLRNALARAHFTEALGRDHFEPAQRGGLFITGIFSLLDALLNIPMSQALASLNLPESINNALVHDDGPYAPYLDLATACERFDQDAIGALADSIGLDADTINLAHVNALIWSEGVEI